MSRIPPLLEAAAINPPNRVEIERILTQLPDPRINEKDRDTGYTALMYIAAGHDDEADIAKLLLKHGADPNLTELIDGKNALHMASQETHTETVKVILESGKINDINATDGEGYTALMNATASWQSKIVKLLLEHGADPNRQDFDKRQTALHIAISSGYVEAASANEPNKPAPIDIIDLLVESKANLNVRDRHSRTPLSLAVSKYGLKRYPAYVRVVKTFLQNGADPNIPDTMELTPLCDAILEHSRRPVEMKKEVELIQTLLEFKADPNVVLNGNSTPLIYAAKSQDVSVVKLLLEYKADPNQPSKYNEGRTALFEVIYIMDDDSIATLLLDAGAQINYRDTYGWTPLMSAIEMENEHRIKFLLDHDADPKIVAGKYTCLLLAPNEAILDMLLAHGASMNDTDAEGDTILFQLIKQGHEKTIPMFVKKGADPNSVNKDGLTVLMFAIRNDYTVFEIVLETKGVDLEKTTPDGKTALFFAMEEKSVDCTAALLEKGANPNHQDSQGNTAAMSALHSLYESGYDVDLISKLFQELLMPCVEHGMNLNLQNQRGRTLLMDTVRYKIRMVSIYLLDQGADTTLRDTDGRTAVDFVQNDEELRELLTKEHQQQKLWTGYTHDDVLTFNELFSSPEKLINISICPFCLQYTERNKGCKYQYHTCEYQIRHRRLFNLYAAPGTHLVQWCSICGRPAVGHLHVPATDGTETRIPELLEPGNASVYNITNEACIMAGGGGVNEKLRRIQAMIRALCAEQAHVGVKPERAAREAIVLAAWNAGLGDEATENLQARQAFNVPCDLPTVLSTTRATAAAANVPTTNPPPVQREGMECSAELAVPASGFVYEFSHTQPDGSVYLHPEHFCVDDLTETLRYIPDSEILVCPLDKGEHCKGKLYPSDITNILGADSLVYQGYRERFNRAAAAAVGGRHRRTRTRRGRRQRGGERPFFSRMTNVQCARPVLRNRGTQKGGRRRRRRLLRRLNLSRKQTIRR